MSEGSIANVKKFDLDFLCFLILHLCHSLKCVLEKKSVCLVLPVLFCLSCLAFLVLSGLVWSCLVLSCLVWSGLVLSGLVLSCLYVCLLRGFPLSLLPSIAILFTNLVIFSHLIKLFNSWFIKIL